MIQFEFLGANISYTKPEVILHNLRKESSRLADLYGKKFSDQYDQFISIENVIKYSLEIVDSYFRELSRNYVKWLVSEGVYSVDEHSLMNNYLFIENYLKAYDLISGKFEELIEDSNQLRAYREYRKDFRGKFIGGGFGLEGAVKGIATAGALNMATGVLHSTFNSIANLGTKALDGVLKLKLYNDKSIKNSLIEGLKRDISQSYIAIIDVLNKELGLSAKAAFTIEDEQRKKALKTNVNKISNPSQRIEIYKELLKLDPLDYSIYDLIMNDFGDSSNELDTIADYFLLDLPKYKMDKIISIVKRADIMEETDINNLLNKVKGRTEKYGCNSSEYKDYLRELDNEISQRKKQIFRNEIKSDYDFINQIFNSLKVPKIKNTIFLRNESQKRFSNALNTYVQLDEGEKILLLHDRSIFGNGKKGFVVTNKSIQISDKKYERRVELKNIEVFKTEGIGNKQIRVVTKGNYLKGGFPDTLLTLGNELCDYSAASELCRILKRITTNLVAESE